MKAIPKIIDDLRTTLLTEARQLLLTEAGTALTIRNVAARCHVAVGTVYNYVQSKDELMALVILEDWQETLAAMRTAAEQASNVLSGLRGIEEELVRFRALYREVWRRHAASMDAIVHLESRHPLLVSQLAEVCAVLLRRYDALWTPHLPVHLAETLLTASVPGSDGFEQMIPILERLIQPS